MWTLRSFLRFSTRRSPYQVLGVKANSSAEEIKKSYRIIAQKYHPDKNPDPSAQKMFIEAKQAYQTLIDEDKRRQYDNENSPRSHGFAKNPFDEFNDEVFKDKSRTYHETFSGGSRRMKGNDIVRDLSIGFLDAVKGLTVDIELDRKTTCGTCFGNKCKPGTAPTRCLACGGSGTIIYRRGGVVMHLECERCKGIGLVIKHPCLDCGAKGINTQNVIERVTIPPGVEDGQSLTVKQKGDESQNGPSGDLIIKIKVNKHPSFRKIDDDIHTNEWLNISQAALGTRRKIKTIWGEKDILVPEGSQDGSTLTIRGEGVQAMVGRGNHIITFRIRIPTRLTDKQRRIFEQLAKQEQQQQNNRKQEQVQEQQNIFDRMKKAFK